MSLTALLRSVSRRWRTFAEAVWPPGPEEAKQAELDRLRRLIERRGRRLLARRLRIERLRDKLARQLARLRELSARLLAHKDEAGLAEWARLQTAAARKRVRVEWLEQVYDVEIAALNRLRLWQFAMTPREVGGL